MCQGQLGKLEAFYKKGEAAGQLRELQPQKTQNQVVEEGSAVCPDCWSLKSCLDKHSPLSQELSWHHTIHTSIPHSREQTDT